MRRSKTVFNLQVVESVDAKPKDMECPLYIYWKKTECKWTLAVQTCFVQGSTVFEMHSFSDLNIVIFYNRDCVTLYICIRGINITKSHVSNFMSW